MIKAVVYLKGGLGDVYSCLAMLPQVMKEKGLKKDEVKIYTDCVYLLNPEYFGKTLQDSMIELLNLGGVYNYEIIPEPYNSAYDINWPSDEAQRDSPIMGGNFDKHDFLFWRFPQTKDFMKEQLEKYPGCTFIDTVVTEFIYEWKDGEYKELTHDRVPLNFVPKEKEKKYLDKICEEKHILIHVRIKAKEESMGNFNRIIKFCQNRKIKCILTGLKDEGIEQRDNIIDLRNSTDEEKISFAGMMYLSAKAKLMLTSSSVQTYHRLYYNYQDKKTISCFAQFRGDYKNYFQQKILDNPNNIFLNADAYYIDKVMDEIDEFWGEKGNKIMILMGMGESGKTTYAKGIAKERNYEYLDFDSFCPYGGGNNFFRTLDSIIKILNENPDKNYILDGYVYPLNGEYLGTDFDYLKKRIKHKIKPVVIYTNAEIISKRVNKRGSPDKVDKDFVIQIYKDISKYWDLNNADFVEASNNEFKRFGSYDEVIKVVKGINEQDVRNFIQKLELRYPHNYQSIELPFGYKVQGYNNNYEYESWDRIKNLFNFKDKKVADIGSSWGFFCFKVKEKGARSVIGFEKNKKDVKIAREVALLNESDVDFEVLDVDKKDIPIWACDMTLFMNVSHNLKNPTYAFAKIFDRSRNVITEVQLTKDKPDFAIISKEKIIKIAEKYKHKLIKEVESARPNRIIMLFGRGK